MKVFISNGLRDKENPKEYVERCRKVVEEEMAKLFPDETIERIDTYFEDFNGNRLQFLGKSIMEGLAVCDVAVFMDDWQWFEGCRSEHFIATQYGIPCYYFSTKN